tara:strand:+ start:19 stop:147 length:129 start_codon:yes stop_codon:yes gene_type:complete
LVVEEEDLIVLIPEIIILIQHLLLNNLEVEVVVDSTNALVIT